MEKEVLKGWSISLQIDDALSIPNAEAAPHGLANQATINELGEVVEKERVTHDLSFPGKESGESINSRIKKEDLEPCFYGHMHSRCIHYIISQRLRNPRKRIFTRKDDFKSAFCQSHLHASSAVKTLTQIETGSGENFLLLPLRTTLGGAPGPSEWGCLAEPIINLANAILSCKDWDPNEIHSPIKNSIPQAKYLDETIPIAPARSIILDIPDNPQGKVDLYINDGVSIA